MTFEPVTPLVGPCKVCGAAAPLLGVVDFHKQCLQNTGYVLDPAGIPIYYRQCRSCGFIFTDALDKWSYEQFSTLIYNSEYAKVDPDYAHARPQRNADWLIKLFGARKRQIACLDYGGGNGKLAQLLRQAGFARAETFDQFGGDHCEMPAGSFNLVTCFEVFEHSRDPKAMASEVARLVQSGGMVVFSTLLQPPDIAKLGLSWWYIAPRNGHISIFSRKSLALLLASVGLKLGSFDAGRHLAFGELPDFARPAITLRSGA